MPKARTTKEWEPDHITGVDPMVGGSTVLRVVMPLDLAPRMNELLSMQHWGRKDVKADSYGWVGRHVEELGSIPSGRLHVAVTRYSATEPDECGSDAIGGKLPIDALVHHGLIGGDSRGHITRSDHWAYARRGHGSFVVEVQDRPAEVLTVCPCCGFRLREEPPPASGRRSRKGVAA